MSPPAIRIQGVWKSFGDCVANAGASLQVERGEIHALVGENGAGKSTLMRLLAGLQPPDSGTIEVEGRDATGWSAAAAIAAGVGMVHQHFMLVPTLSVAENVVLGREPRRGVRLDLARAVAEVDKLARDSGLEVPATRRVGELPVGIAQRVEILKTLYRGARILILDEPTAVLSPLEVQNLLAILRRLRAQGTTIVLITHKLEEVAAVADRVTVMRRGQTVAAFDVAATTPQSLAQAMVGRPVLLPGDQAALAQAPTPVAASVPPILRVADLVVRGAGAARAVDGVSFELRPGEVLGIAGVEGNGQTELVEALAGLRRAEAGTVTLDGRDLLPLDVRGREALGLGHIPEDRHRRGLVLDYTLADNLILGRQSRFARHGLLDFARRGAFAAERIATFDVRPADPELAARALSGGNQQKVVVAREMGHGFRVLLAAQPTRGVDVGAIELIHERLRAARAAGKAILLVSSELSEILALADRVAVLYRGRFAVVLERAAASAEILGPFMTGVRSGAAGTAA